MAQNFETWKNTTLALPASTTDTELTLKSVPTVTSGRLLLISWSVKERVSFSGITGSKVTWVVRNLSQTWDPVTWGTGLAWIAGTEVRLVAMWDQLADRTADNSYKNGTTQTFDKVIAKSIKFTGTTTVWVQPIELTTTQRDALNMTGINTGFIWNTTTTTYQWYSWGTWVDFALSALAPMLLTGDQTASGIKTFSSLLKATDKQQFWGGAENIDQITMWAFFRYWMWVQTWWLLRIFRHPAWVGITFWTWDWTTFTEHARISSASDFTFDSGNIRRTASDAEALAGSSTTTNLTPYQGTLITKHEVQTFTRNTTGVQTITHSLWKVPKSIRITAKWDVNVATWHINSSDWLYDGTNQNCVYTYVNAWSIASTTTNKCVYITQTVSWTEYLLSGSIQNVTNTQFEINWTNTLWNSYVQQIKGIIELS